MTLKLRLAEVPIFAFLTAEQAQSLSPMAKIVEKKGGEAVVMAGEEVPGLYLVGQGQVGVYPKGAKRPIVIFSQGESFGEMAFIEESMASATVRVEGDGAKLILFRKADLLDLMTTDAEVSAQLYRGIAVTISRKLRSTNARLSKELEAGQKFFRKLYAPGQALEPVAVVNQRTKAQFMQIREMISRAQQAACETDAEKRSENMAEIAKNLAIAEQELKKTCDAIFEQLHIMGRLVDGIEGFVLCTQQQATSCEKTFAKK